jgi:hypothetical protein
VRAGPAPVDTARLAAPAPTPRPQPAVQPGRPPARVRPDTTPTVRPVMPRKSPSSTAVIVLSRPLVPKAAYHVRAIGIRGLLGHTGDSDRVYTVPAPPPPPAAKPVTTPGAIPATTPPATPPPAPR